MGMLRLDQEITWGDLCLLLEEGVDALIEEAGFGRTLQTASRPALQRRFKRQLRLQACFPKRAS